MTVAHDPSKQAPDEPLTFEEVLENLGTFAPEDAITFAEEPHTMLGMLMQHNHQVSVIDYQDGNRTICLPEINVDIAYDADGKLQEINIHDAQALQSHTQNDSFSFDDFEVTPEEEQAHYDRLNAEAEAEDSDAE